MSSERKVDVAILGAGTAGNYTLSQVRAAGKSFVIINGGPLGTTCARVGCVPSKLLIQAADAFHERALLDEFGIRGGAGLKIDVPAVLARVRKIRDSFANPIAARATGELSEHFIDGYARFVAPDVVKVNGSRVRANRIVVATGSTPVVPNPWQAFGDRVLTTDTLFEQEDLPPRMAVIGLGAIGLEMGQALSRLGIEVTGFGSREYIAGLSDPVVNQAAIERISCDMPLYLGERAQVVEEEDGLRVSSGSHSVVVDKILVSAGRAPNIPGLGLEEIGAPMDPSGRPEYDPQTMQVGDLPIFLAGDVNGYRTIMPEAADEGRMAGCNVSHQEIAAFRRKTSMGIVFTDPNIACVGTPFSELDTKAIAVGEDDFSKRPRAMIMGKNYGVLRLYANRATGRLLGAAMCVTGGEHLAHLVAWSIQQGLTVIDLQRLPYYHPVLEEGLGDAVEDLASKLDIKAPAPANVTPMSPVISSS